MTNDDLASNSSIMRVLSGLRKSIEDIEFLFGSDPNVLQDGIATLNKTLDRCREISIQASQQHRLARDITNITRRVLADLRERLELTEHEGDDS